jgi:FkbM family methyltransferase
MYSQNKEEQYILDFFKNKQGKFLDIGAYDGIKFSNTYALVEKQWNGVLIEPSPITFCNLIKNLAGKQNLRFCNSAISIKSELREFYDAKGDAISTFDKLHKEKWEKNAKVNYIEFYIKTMTIQEIFDKFGYDFDFINLDVEGINYELFLEMFNHISKLNNLKLICVEHDNKINEIISVSSTRGFKEIHRNGENLILGR